MLVRAFRLTDKLGNAILRVAIWLGEWLLDQIYQVRIAITALVVGIVGLVQRNAANELSSTAGAGTSEARRVVMARRAAEQATRTTVVEDPLKTQNRALSIFTVLLILALIGLVVWFTSAGSPRQTALSGGGGIVLVTPLPPTTTPTITPTPTLPPDPLRVSGSLVYTLRQAGHDNLYAYSIGTANPVRLTNTTADDRDPAWSPDGTKIAFASRRDGNWELYTLDLNTGVTTRLTYSLGYKGAPTWSPDGKFIAYEAYDGSNLDIYIIPSDASADPQRLTYNPAPDFSPAWSPGLGRQIAYVSLREGNAEIFIINLGQVDEDRAVQLTNTGIDENYPVWSPDGKTIAYSGRENGIEAVFTKAVDDPNAQANIVGQGRQPTWSPDGNSLLFALDSGTGASAKTTLVGGQFGTAGVTATAITLPARGSHPRWTGASLPQSLVTSGGIPSNDQPLYNEVVSQNPNPPLYQLRPINVRAPSPLLSDRVDDSFNALRSAVNVQAGFDFLGTLEDALWDLSRLPEPGQSRQDWHYTGRDISFDRNLVFNTPAPIEVVREDIGVSTYWRVYIRVADFAQNGQLGEPLKQIPWDFDSRRTDPSAFEQGGKLKNNIPAGYYIDFTKLAEDYGWTWTPAGRNWRSNYSSILYWEYSKRESITWEQAMFELFTTEQVQAFIVGPTPVPTNRPTATDLPRRTATPASAA